MLRHYMPVIIILKIKRFGEEEIDVKTVSIAQVECGECGQGSEERMVKESPQFAPSLQQVFLSAYHTEYYLTGTYEREE
jgi:hypothetical protein